MRSLFKRPITMVVLIIGILLFPYATVLATPNSNMQSPMNRTAEYLLVQEKNQAELLSPWGYIALAVSGKSLEQSKVLKSGQMQLAGLKYGETNNYSILVLMLLATGSNPYDYQGENLVQKIQSSQLPEGKFADNIDRSGQGEKGEQVLASAHMWAVLALKAAGADITDPKAAKQWIIAQQHSDGSFNWNIQDKKPDVDSTGMALMALGAEGEKSDSRSVMDAVNYLKQAQENNGGFAAWGATNLESSSMVIGGLTAVGIDPAGQEWSKSGGNLLTSLVNFQLQDGSFEHVKGMGTNMMASEQALLALGELYYGKTLVELISEKARGTDTGTTPAQRIICFKPGETRYELSENGSKQVLEADVAPFLENGRTYVPLRYLALALGVPESGIIWSPSAQTATLIHNGVELDLAIGGNIIYVNNEPRPMDVVPMSKPPGRIFLPARFVAEAFGYTVRWDEQEQAVIISALATQSSWQPEKTKQSDDIFISIQSQELA